MKKKFNIGDYVTAIESKIMYDSIKYIPGEDVKKKIYTKECIHTNPTPREGMIVGATYRFKGVCHGPGYYDDPAYFQASEGILFWQIREGYLNKAFESLEEDITLIHKADRIGLFNIPWKKTYYPQQRREADSSTMKELHKHHLDMFPRDAKGRFIK